MAEPLSGIRVITSPFVAPGTAFVVDVSALVRLMDMDIARQFIVPGRVLRGPSFVEREFRRLRRSLAMSCPLIAPPEWRDLEDLDPPLSPLAWRALSGGLSRPSVRIIDMGV